MKNTCNHAEGSQNPEKQPTPIVGKKPNGQYQMTSFINALELGNLEEIELALAKDPSLVFNKDSEGMTPLHTAAAKFCGTLGLRKMVKLLLAHHADANAKANNSETPLHIAAKRGLSEMVEVLLTSKADVNARDNRGETPLHLTAIHGETYVAKLLLANGANVNDKNNDGRTPLHFAAQGRGTKWDGECHYKVVEILLAHHADANAKDYQGRTPLDLADKVLFSKVPDLLRRYGIQSTKNIHDAASAGEVERVRVLLKNDPNLVFSNDAAGKTPLHAAAEATRRDVVELLLSNRAEVNARDKNGNTPLHLAAHNYGKAARDVTKLLLANQGDVNAVNTKALKPLGCVPKLGYKVEDVGECLREHVLHNPSGNDLGVNFNLWKSSSEPAEWLKKHLNGWNHQDWLDLLTSLRLSQFWPMNEASIGLHLEMLLPTVRRSEEIYNLSTILFCQEWPERKKACDRLLEIGGEEAYDVLVEHLGTKELSRRYGMALPEYQTSDGYYFYGHCYVNIEVYDALQAAGRGAIPALHRALKDRHPETRKAATGLLYDLGETKWIRMIVGDESDFSRL
jgi:ankyrin repeat protein